MRLYNLSKDIIVNVLFINFTFNLTLSVILLFAFFIMSD